MFYRTFILLYCFFINQISYSQCDGNLIRNGSFELDTVGELLPGQFWDRLDGFPFIEDTQDNETTYGAGYDYGSPSMSDDGGNFQFIGYQIQPDPNASSYVDRIGQQLKLKSSIPHKLTFEFMSMALFESGFERWLGAIEVKINGEKVFTTDLSTSLYKFEHVSFIYTPESKDIYLEFKISEEKNLTILKAMGIDGVCFKPVQTGFFCEP